MRFLIVAPNYSKNSYYEFPLGLAYISGSLRQHGFDVECLNLNHFHEPAEKLLEEKIIGNKIDALLTGGLSPFFTMVEELFRTARRIKPDIINIIGGGLVSSAPEIVMSGIDADIAVLGEGELTIVELASALDAGRSVERISGIAYHDRSGHYVSTPPRSVISNIDEIPFPDYDGFGIEHYLEGQLPNSAIYLYPYDRPRCLPILATRSCPFACTFCYLTMGRKYRKRSLDNLFAEIDQMVALHDIKMLDLLDQLFSDDKNRLTEFCERIKRYNLKWTVQLRVPSVDREIIGVMKDAGCFQISYGLESASPRVLKSMKKKTHVPQMERALALTYEIGIGIQGNFIFFDEAESVETALETLTWWQTHPEYQLNIFPIQSYPGTAYWDMAVEKGLITDELRFLKIQPPPALNITAMSDAEFTALNKVIGLLVNQYVMRMPAPSKASLIQAGKGPDRIVTYQADLRCPRCESYQKFQRIDVNGIACFGAPSISCRSCNQRMLLPVTHHLPYLEERVKKLLTKHPDARIGLLTNVEGVYDVRTLLALTDLSPERVTCIYGQNWFQQEINIDRVPLLDRDRELAVADQKIDLLLVAPEIIGDEIEPYPGLLSALYARGVAVEPLYERNETTLHRLLHEIPDTGLADFEKIIDCRRVALFGSGAGGLDAFHLAQLCGWEVVRVIDNDPAKCGTHFLEYEISGPDTLALDDYDLVIVASEPGKKAIFSQLETMGLRQGKHYIFYTDPIISVALRQQEISTLAASPFGALFGKKSFSLGQGCKRLSPIHSKA